LKKIKLNWIFLQFLTSFAYLKTNKYADFQMIKTVLIPASASKPFPKKILWILLILSVLIPAIYEIVGAYTAWRAYKELEDVIDDPKVWEEVKDLPIPIDSFAKMIAEIKGVKSGNRRPAPCVQYVLEASVDGWYVCYKCPSKRVF
jgi:hypothetical protein